MPGVAQWFRLAAALVACLILLTAGCARQRADHDQTGLTPVTLRATAATPLLHEAEKSIRAGDLPQAEILLERALRIEPENSDLWHGMARVKFSRGDYHQAVQFSLKSLSLAPQNRSLEIANWRLMEQAYLNLGDLDGAGSARKELQRLTSW